MEPEPKSSKSKAVASTAQPALDMVIVQPENAQAKSLLSWFLSDAYLKPCVTFHIL